MNSGWGRRPRGARQRVPKGITQWGSRIALDRSQVRRMEPVNQRKQAHKTLNTIHIISSRFFLLLSRISAGIILFIVFFVIFTPIGLVLRLFGIDLLDKTIQKKRKSYWKKKGKSGFGHLNFERQA